MLYYYWVFVWKLNISWNILECLLCALRGNSISMLKSFMLSNSWMSPCCLKIIENINTFPVGIYLLKVNNRNTRTSCEICSKLTIKIPYRWIKLLIWVGFGGQVVGFQYNPLMASILHQVKPNKIHSASITRIIESFAHHVFLKYSYFLL